MPHVVVNGTPLELPEAPSLADALDAAGVHLPTLCHDDRLAPSGNCRLCLVRIKGLTRVRSACADARGMSSSRLDRDGLQWPCPDQTHPGTPILHVDTWPSGKLAPLARTDYSGTPERTTPEFPFVLGRGRTRELRTSDLLEISPADATAAHLQDGDRVRLVSRYGAAELPVRTSSAMPAGELFATFHAPATLLNSVTGPHVDPITSTPEYKVTAVRMEKV